MRRRSQKQGVTVRRRARGDFGADIRTCTWAIFDHNRLAEILRELRRHESHQYVRCAARRIRNDDPDRFRWVIVGMRPKMRGGATQIDLAGSASHEQAE